MTQENYNIRWQAKIDEKLKHPEELIQNHIVSGAERQGGEPLGEQSRKPGGTDKSIMSQDVTLSKPKLKELGIDRMQFSRWQQIAGIPEKR